MPSDLILRKFVEPVSALCVTYDLERFPRTFSKSPENKLMEFFGLSKMLYDPCTTTGRSYTSYMILYNYKESFRSLYEIKESCIMSDASMQSSHLFFVSATKIMVKKQFHIS